MHLRIWVCLSGGHANTRTSLGLWRGISVFPKPGPFRLQTPESACFASDAITVYPVAMESETGTTRPACLVLVEEVGSVWNIGKGPEWDDCRVGLTAYLLVSQWVLRQSGCVCTQEEQVSAMAAGFYMEWVSLGQGVPVVGARQELESSSWKKRASEASYWHLDCWSLQGWNWLGISHIDDVGGSIYPREHLFSIPNILGFCRRHLWAASRFWFLHCFPS